MGIGASIFLIAVGAIIAFALEARVGWLDLDVVGWVLMLAGLFGLLLAFGVFSRRRTVVRSSTQRSAYRAPTYEAPMSGAMVEPTVVEPPPQRTVVDTPGQRTVVDQTGPRVVDQPAPQPGQRRVTEYEEIERPL
jgi:hypothetical protein